MIQQFRMNATELAMDGTLLDFLTARSAELSSNANKLNNTMPTLPGVSQTVWTSNKVLKTDGIARADYYFAPVGSAQNVADRIDSFADMADGWMGEGSSCPNKSELAWLSRSFLEWYSSEIPTPSVFPTPRGTIEMEWSGYRQTIILDISPKTKKAAWLSFYTTDDDENDIEEEIDLGDSAGWKRLKRLLKTSFCTA